MQAHSTCGAGPYKQFWMWGVTLFVEEELQRDRIHTEPILPPERMAYMYRGGTVGKVDGLHPTYRYLVMMFRKSIDCKSGDKGTIVYYSRNLLHRMTPDA